MAGLNPNTVARCAQKILPLVWGIALFGQHLLPMAID